MAAFIKNLALIAVSMLVALLLAEGASRLVMPVKYGNEFVTMDGAPFNPRTAGRLTPDARFRMVAQEFDAVVTHTPDGYRGLAQPVNPEVIFIGDSFTYGIGLNDKETIPHVYCRALDVSCANLGVPGTATGHQLERLDRFLQEKNWRPRTVRLLFMGMTGALMAGNDFSGNLEYEAQQQRTDETGAQAPQTKSPLHWLLGQRKLLLEHSNLVRILYYVYGPVLRAELSPDTAADDLEKALAATERQLLKLHSLSEDYGFDYAIYIIHPMQDLMTGGYQQTWTTLQDIAPTMRVYTTAPALLGSGDAAQYYFPYDGHLNAKGARLVARYIAGMDEIAESRPVAQ